MVLGVFVFIIMFVPSYFGRGAPLWVFIAAGLVWALDRPWNVLDYIRKINRKIGLTAHLKGKRKAPTFLGFPLTPVIVRASAGILSFYTL
jgi:hypothetical protein